MRPESGAAALVHRADAAPSSRAATLLEWALVLAVFAAFGGAPPPHVNETHYLTKARHYWDPSYCPGDLFLDSADPHLAFYWTVGWLTRLMPLSAVAWVGRILAWGLLAAAWVRLSRIVMPRQWLAVLSAALWVVLTDKCNFAGEWVVGGVEAKCFAYAAVLMGLAAMAENRWTAPWVWFGVAAAMHVLVGAWAVLAAFGVWLSERREQRPRLRTLLPGLVVGGLLSLPGLLPALALDRGVDGATATEAARIYVFERLPHHLAPLELPRPELTARILRHGALVIALAGLAAWPRLTQSSRGRAKARLKEDAAQAGLGRLMRFAAISLAATAAGLGIEWALRDNPEAAARVLRYYWFRQGDVAVPLAVALAIAPCVPALWRQRSKWAKVAALAPAAWCIWVLGSTLVVRWQRPIPPGAARMENFAAWQNACTWVREHAPPEAMFLIPREAQSFKWYAERADVGNRKDVPQDAANVVRWRRRCEELFPVGVGADGLPERLDSPEEWGTPRTRALAERYGATHVIARSEPPLDFAILHAVEGLSESPGYTIYSTGVSRAD